MWEGSPEYLPIGWGIWCPSHMKGHVWDVLGTSRQGSHHTTPD